MTAPPRGPDLDQVLDAFAAEAAPDETTLAAYIRRYPEHALALADLAHDLRLDDGVAEADTLPDTVWLEASWRRFAERVPHNATAAATANPFAGLAPARLVEIREALDIPSSVLTAFRDRLLEAATVPLGFMKRLAAQLGASTEGLAAYLDLPSQVAPATSHKAGRAPAAAAKKATFEEVLMQAMVPPERRQALLAEDD